MYCNFCGKKLPEICGPYCTFCGRRLPVIPVEELDYPEGQRPEDLLQTEWPAAPENAGWTEAAAPAGAARPETADPAGAEIPEEIAVSCYRTQRYSVSYDTAARSLLFAETSASGNWNSDDVERLFSVTPGHVLRGLNGCVLNSCEQTQIYAPYEYAGYFLLAFHPLIRGMEADQIEIRTNSGTAVLSVSFPALDTMEVQEEVTGTALQDRTRTFHWQFDEAGRVVSFVVLSEGGEASLTETFLFDENGQLSGFRTTEAGYQDREQTIVRSSSDRISSVETSDSAAGRSSYNYHYCEAPDGTRVGGWYWNIVKEKKYASSGSRGSDIYVAGGIDFSYRNNYDLLSSWYSGLEGYEGDIEEEDRETIEATYSYDIDISYGTQPERVTPRTPL